MHKNAKALLGTASLLLAGASPAAQAAPAAACQALTGRTFPASTIALPTRGAQIDSAQMVPARASGGPAPQGRGGQPLPHPEYCRIEGSILPVDPAAPMIKFAVAVPQVWNGSAWQVGGSANNGSIQDLTNAGGAGTPTPTGAPSLLTRGNAVYGSDSGHQGQDTAWVTNRESWVNFSYEQLKKTHDAAFAVIEALQGRRPRLSYFTGGSQGGREALEAVSRYGADYDGVVAMVPLAYFQGLLIDPTIKAIAQTKPGAWIPPSKHGLITAAVLKTCDGLDGLEDGVIGNVLACNARLDTEVASAPPLAGLRCPTGRDEGDACLSDAQLAMVNSLHAAVRWPYRLPNGFSDWPGWPGGFTTGLLGRNQPNPEDPSTGSFGIGGGVQRALFGKGDPNFNLFKFDMVAYRQGLEQLSRDLDVPTDWSAFLRSGGKLIWVTAAGDTVTNPNAQIRLYQEVAKRHGQAGVDRSVRYYLLPNGEHSRQARAANGDLMPSSWDIAGVLRDWVENGVAPPDAPVLATYSGDTITATRPICRFPAYPRYIGGSPRWAAAFSCQRGAGG